MADSALPTGTVTFVFTDIEGSTRLLERDPDGYPELLRRHCRLLTGEFERHGGVIFGTEGDAMFVAFPRASAAMAAAVDAQRGLLGAEWPDGGSVRVRMGIHTGEADIVDGTYVGMTVHIAARVAAAAHGGQVLVTDVTRRMGSEVGTIALGSHRLKDVGEHELHQLTAAGLATEFPPLRTLSAMPNNLPAPVDEFVGREAEVAEVLQALVDSRLVTLTGAGGSGKTRLALEIADAALTSFPDGVWFVGLNVAADADRIVSLVAAALRLAERADEPLELTLERWLGERQLLLVLDNCEHLVAGAAAFADRYLPRAAGLRILATSREILGGRGERAIATPPLSVSDDPTLTGVSDAVELFLVRAAAAVPSFDPDAADRATVAQVCRRLDGLPLAIELAAARLRALALPQLAARLDDRFRLLGGGRSTERTLEAVVAWSYDLLTDAERSLFARLAMFPASFGLDTAEAVVSGDGIEELEVLDVLTRLVEKSLVTTVATGDAVRYQLLETLRQYALDRLEERGEVERWRDRLLAWAVGRVEHIEEVLRTPAQDVAIHAAIQDAVSFRSAMDWAFERGDLVAAVRIAAAVPLGLNGERRTIIASVLDQLGPTVEPLVVGHAYSAIGNMAFEQSDWERSSEANARAAEAFRRAGSEWRAAWATYLGAHSAWGAGDLDTVDELIAQVIESFRRADDGMGLGYSLWIASLRAADLREAERLAEEADGLLRTSGAPMGIAHNVEGRGIIALDRGDVSTAARFVAEAVELFSGYGNLGCTAHALEAAAVVVDAGGPGPTAVELLGAADEFRLRSGQGHRPWEIRARHGAIEERIGQLPSAMAEAALAVGRSHTLASAATAARDALSHVAERVTAAE